jgi:hypothetical protein
MGKGILDGWAFAIGGGASFYLESSRGSSKQKTFGKWGIGHKSSLASIKYLAESKILVG